MDDMFYISSIKKSDIITWKLGDIKLLKYTLLDYVK